MTFLRFSEIRSSSRKKNLRNWWNGSLLWVVNPLLVSSYHLLYLQISIICYLGKKKLFSVYCFAWRQCRSNGVYPPKAKCWFSIKVTFIKVDWHYFNVESMFFCLLGICILENEQRYWFSQRNLVVFSGHFGFFALEKMLSPYNLAYIRFGFSTSKLTRNSKRNYILWKTRLH